MLVIQYKPNQFKICLATFSDTAGPTFRVRSLSQLSSGDMSPLDKSAFSHMALLVIIHFLIPKKRDQV